MKRFIHLINPLTLNENNMRAIHTLYQMYITLQHGSNKQDPITDIVICRLRSFLLLVFVEV